MSQKAAIRRRKQAVNNFRHIAPLRRSRYSAYNKAKADKRDRVKMGKR